MIIFTYPHVILSTLSHQDTGVFGKHINLLVVVLTYMLCANYCLLIVKLIHSLWTTNGDMGMLPSWEILAILN